MSFINLIVPSQLAAFSEEGNSETFFINEYLSFYKNKGAVPLEF